MDIKKDYIRVTELLKPFTKFDQIPTTILQAKAEIGTNVHEAIVNSNLGLPLCPLTEREHKYLDSYLKWEELMEPTFLSSEQRLYDEDLMMTGQVDAIVSFPGRQEGRIIDFKTSLNANESSWCIQLGWYYLLCKKNSIQVNRNAFIVQLKDTGAPAKSYPFEITDSLIGLCHKLYDVYVHFNPVKNKVPHNKDGWCC